MKKQSFKDIIVWQKSYELVLEIYRVTKDFPKDEIYGLSQQMRRATVSRPIFPKVMAGSTAKNIDIFYRWLMVNCVSWRRNIY